MKMTLIALAAASLFAADDFTLPSEVAAKRPKIIYEDESTSRWLFSGDFLYWTPEMEGLKFANRSTPIEKQIFNENKKEMETVRTFDKESLEVKGDWEPGIRLSMGYLFDEMGWDALLNWTYFRNEPSRQVTSGEKEWLTPAALPPGNYITSVDMAKGKWYLLQNGVDVEVGRRYPVGEIFLARPFFGLKGISLRSKTVFQYGLTNFGSAIEFPSKSNFLGAGPRIGGNVDYEFGYGIGIFALGSASVLYGQFETNFNGAPDQNSALRTVTVMQIQMGTQWKKSFKDKYYLGFQAAWEQNFYSRVNRSLRHLEDEGGKGRYQENGDLILKGLTASCHLDF